ncbi:MAG: DNA-directed RNA polymerase subunit beta, partial [Elusimicrobiota bacterium]
ILQYNFFPDNKKSNGLLNYIFEFPKRTPEEARAKGISYESTLKVHFRLLKERGNGKVEELSEQEVNLCDIPIMTESGTFIINGSERVIVNQIHRSPGVIFEEDEEKLVSQMGKKLFKASIIPYRGAWIDFEFDIANVLFVRIDKKRKIPATILLHAIGFEKDSDILKIFYDVDVYNKKDFSKCTGMILAEDVVDKKTGEIIREANNEIRPDDVKSFEKKVESISVINIDKTKNDLTIILTLKEEKKLFKGDKKSKKEESINIIYKILRSPEFISSEIAESFLDNLLFKTRRYDLTKVGRYKINNKLNKLHEEFEKKSILKKFNYTIPGERKATLTKEDILAATKYIIELNNNTDGYEIDDIDHLGNRRVRSVGELLENQVRIGLLSMTRLIREKMSSMDKKAIITPRFVINPMPLMIAIRRFFGTSQLSQFMDKTNPLAELTHKRRLSALGPGGLHRKRAGFEVRDVHYTHYGRICPIETPEGPNIGLITSLACYARVNEYGLIETPYRKVEKGKITDKIEYLTADKEDKYTIAQANVSVEKDNYISLKKVACRSCGDVRFDVEAKNVDFIDISPMQLVSVSTALIPFLEHDDANRALMGSNMQRQAVPLLITETPLLATGIEKKVAIDSFAVITARRPGEVVYVNSTEIGIYTDDNNVDIYSLVKYNRSNQDTCINYYPIVKKGDKVRKNEIIADGPCTSDGQISLGKNVNVAFMAWEGYNFEDAIIVNERLIQNDVFTSIHIQEFQIEARDTKIGQEEITRDIPNVGVDDLLNLDESGIIRIGAEVSPGDILVGKTIPKGEQQVTVEERLLKAIFGKKAEDVVDASLRVPPGVRGKVIDVQILIRWEKSSKKVEREKIEEINEKYQKKLNENKKLAEEILSQ